MLRLIFLPCFIFFVYLLLYDFLYNIVHQALNTVMLCRWEFLTLGKDISFGVTLIPDGSSKEKSMIPSSRVQSHMVPEDGTITCEELGTCESGTFGSGG